MTLLELPPPELDIPFPTPISRAVFYNKYSRWDHRRKRRETKPEAIDRAFTFLEDWFMSRGGYWLPGERELVQSAMHKLEALPSMRLLWSAGPALARNHIMAYNCSFITCNRLRKFSEALYILMAGTGVGYSVEAQYVSDLPKIKRQQRKTGSLPVWTIEDTTEGWADAVNAGIESWWNGLDIEFDGSQVRPAGAILKTKGGRASGVQPLLNSLQSIRTLILNGQGRNPKPIMVHDIMCLLAQVVVVGGIRRSSLISLFDIDDLEMRMAKHGEFWNATPWRAMANNSIVYNERPTNEQLLSIWGSMIAGHSGEPGIYNREAFRTTAPRRMKYRDVGVNPCGEINLRDMQFCNLSEIVARSDDRLEDLVRKTNASVIIGTIQASLTNFRYLDKKWQENCEEEALLGASVTGQMDCAAFRDPEVQRTLRRYAIDVNRDFAERIGIRQSAAITTGKPSGTLSLFVDASSGSHTRWSQFGIRRMRLNSDDPMLALFRAMGLVINVDPVTPSTFVVDFPFKAPAGAITRHDLTAMQQVEYWLSVKQNYAEHNQSATIYVKDDEWIQVLAWIDANWDLVGGLAFLPTNDHVYPLAPFEEITEAQYVKLMEVFPVFTDQEFAASLAAVESEDQTIGSTELACMGGQCDVN